jgi:hypothetical protein
LASVSFAAESNRHGSLPFQLLVGQPGDGHYVSGTVYDSWIAAGKSSVC